MSRATDEVNAASRRSVTRPDASRDPGSRPVATAGAILSDVLDQFARNFLLNDLELEQSAKLLEGAKGDVHFELPRREPRRRASEIEQVHQARVSIRRLRSTLRTFAGLFNPEWLDPTLTELSWYAAVLGEVRDLDVLRSSIEKSLWTIDDDRIQALVTGRLERQFEMAQDRIAVEKSTKRYACLVDDIAALATSPGLNDASARPAQSALHDELRGAWRGLRRARRAARREPTNDHLHRLRIELKRLQCASEVVGLVAGKPAVKVARAAESLQSRLGVVHDEVVATAWLRTLIVAEPRLKRPLREIIELHDDARREAKRGWSDELDKLDRRWRRFDS